MSHHTPGRWQSRDSGSGKSVSRPLYLAAKANYCGSPVPKKCEETGAGMHSRLVLVCYSLNILWNSVSNTLFKILVFVFHKCDWFLLGFHCTAFTRLGYQWYIGSIEELRGFLVYILRKQYPPPVLNPFPNQCQNPRA